MTTSIFTADFDFVTPIETISFKAGDDAPERDDVRAAAVAAGKIAEVETVPMQNIDGE